MKGIRALSVAVIVFTLAGPVRVFAQFASESTRFSIGGGPVLTEPIGEFRKNLSNHVGGGGSLLYHIDRTGFFGLRFDVSGIFYGSETRQVPISESIGGRILLDETTRNSITTISFGPELAWPKGRIRPYINGGISTLLFRTTTSLEGTDSEGNVISTTNFKDNAGAWFVGGGVRVPIGSSNVALRAITLEFGARYHSGATASYLQQGSIQDLPGGAITITPLMSRTPYIAYVAGIRVRIPRNPAASCPRFLC
jgi:hypothetical protein